MECQNNTSCDKCVEQGYFNLETNKCEYCGYGCAECEPTDQGLECLKCIDDRSLDDQCCP